MSEAAVSALLGAHAALDLALDGNDPAAIEAAAEAYRAAVFDVRAAGAWRARPELAKMAAELLGRVETTQQRVKNLTRDTRERIAAIDAARAAQAPRLYTRSGTVAR